MGSNESHFNVSIGSDGQIHKTVSTNHNLFELRERRAEAVSNRGPSAYQPNALPLGQTGSHTETVRFIRDGENVGKGVWRWGKRESINLSLHCHHQNDQH